MQNVPMYINESLMRQKIDELKIERKNMELIFQKLKEDNLDMITYWSGDTGETSYETVKKYVNRYDKILKKIDSYISFLENTISAHNIMDKTINNKIDENVNASLYS